MAPGNDPTAERHTGTAPGLGLQRNDWPLVGRDPAGGLVKKLDVEQDARRLCQDPLANPNGAGARPGQDSAEKIFGRTDVDGDVRLPGDALPAGRSHVAHLSRQQEESEASRTPRMDLVGFRQLRRTANGALARDEGGRWRADLPLARPPTTVRKTIRSSFL